MMMMTMTMIAMMKMLIMGGATLLIEFCDDTFCSVVTLLNVSTVSPTRKRVDISYIQ